jgi:thioredoxin-related protein
MNAYLYIMTKRFYIMLLAVLLAIPMLSMVHARQTNQQDEKTSSAEEKDGLTWYTDLNEVHQLNQETGKPIFGFFTGSDWCGWCMKLQRDVFKKEAFVTWASEKVILMELDFPKRKKQAEELKKQNQGMQQAFRITGYPTVWLFNTSVNEETKQFHLSALGKLGYPRGAEKGKEEVKFIDEANALLDAADKASEESSN